MCQNAETECYLFRNPQPVKLAEKRSDALRTPDGEYKLGLGLGLMMMMMMMMMICISYLLKAGQLLFDVWGLGWVWVGVWVQASGELLQGSGDITPPQKILRVYMQHPAI